MILIIKKMKIKIAYQMWVAASLKVKYIAYKQYYKSYTPKKYTQGLHLFELNNLWGKKIFFNNLKSKDKLLVKFKN